VRPPITDTSAQHPARDRALTAMPKPAPRRAAFSLQSAGSRAEKDSARKACEWLAKIPSDRLTAEQHIQRIFVVSAFAIARPAVFRKTKIELGRLAGELPKFPFGRFPGDPFFAVAGHRLLTCLGVSAETLAEVTKAVQSVLFGIEQNELATPLWAGLLFGKDRSSFLAAPNPADLATLLGGDRELVMETCRVLMHISCCGTIPVQAPHLHSALPLLCVSYARSFDVEAVCRLLRACAYIGIGDSTQCRWAREWLLHQQQSDGRFGMLDLEAHRGGWSSEPVDLNLLPTLEALWSLTELASPGILVRCHDVFPFLGQAAHQGKR
jgi:hypothetical protein